jgi:flagellar biosynthesis protein FlhG
MTRAAIHPGHVRDDQATRLRAMVEAMERRVRPPAEPQGLPRHVRRAKVITFSSGKGGVGKTNTCVNLAIALAQSGQRTVVLDADLGMANADVLCGLTPARRLEHYIGVADLAPGGRPRTPHEAAALAERSLRDLAIDAPGGFRLVPGAAGIARMADLSAREQARLIAGLADLDRDADLILVDTGAGLGREIIAFIETADLPIVVTTPEPTAMADAYALIKCIAARGARGLRDGDAPARPPLSLVVNQVSGHEEAAAVHARISAVSARFLGFAVPLLGWVAQDPSVGMSVRKRHPVMLEHARSPASRDLRSLAEALARAVRPSPAAAQVKTGLSGWLARTILRSG